MIDPALHEVLLSVAPSEEVEVVMLLAPGRDPPPPARPVARFGDVATCRVAAGALMAVREGCLSLKASRSVVAVGEVGDLVGHPEDGAVGDESRRPPGLRERGAGSIVGCIDFGCDFAHPNFRRRDGSTRLLALWDQRRPARADNRYGYGTMHDRAAIDRALAAADPYTALGYHPADAEISARLGSHGTHVLDLAAGSGTPSGVAPEADLVFVHLSARNTPLIGGLGDSVHLLEAVDFVRSVARDRSWSCNASVGRCGGDHTGRSLVERALDAVVEERPGRCIVLSCGNYAAKRQAAHGWVHPVGSTALRWIVQPSDVTPNELELWYGARDRFLVELEAPTGDRISVARGASADIVVGGRIVGRLYHRDFDPAAGGDHHVDCFLGIAAPGGEWTLTVRGVDVVDGRYHAWIERDGTRPGAQSVFAEDQASARYTLGSIATGFRTITVGAVDPRTGAPGRFSSHGPTRDDRVRPDCAAPGVGILAARSTPRGGAPGSGGSVRMSGTSMAAPQVTGTVALMFAAAPRPLHIQETRALLLGTCARAERTDPLRIGAGVLDIGAAVAAAGAIDEIEATEEGTMHTYDGADGWRPWSDGGDTPASPVGDDPLAELFGDATDEPAMADALYRELTGGGPPTSSPVEVIAFPGQRLTSALQPGDVIVRVAPGEPGLGHGATLVDGRLFDRESLGALNMEPEGWLPGAYARVRERGRFAHSPADGFARRVTDESGRLPAGQIIVRVGEPRAPDETGPGEDPAVAAPTWWGESPDALESSELDGPAETADSPELAEVPTPVEVPAAAGPSAATIAVGRRLRERAPSGVAVALYTAEDPELTREGRGWAVHENAVGPTGATIRADELEFGRAIADAGNVTRTIADLGAALRTAVDAAPAAAGVAPAAGTGPSLVRVLALFTHGWGTTIAIGGRITRDNVAEVVRAMAPVFTTDVRIVVYGCSVARGQTEPENWRATTMTRGGRDSLCALMRDALLDEGKTAAEVWGHTERGHTTRNWALRRFAAADGAGSDGVPFAGEIVFGATQRDAALADIERALSAIGYATGAAARARLIRRMRETLDIVLYDGYAAANLVARTQRNNLTYLGENLAEMAPVHTEEVARIIREYWRDEYWTAARQERAAQRVADILGLRRAPASVPSTAPSATPTLIPQ